MNTLADSDLMNVVAGGDGGEAFAYDLGRALGFVFTTATHYPNSGLGMTVAIGNWVATSKN